MEEEGVERDGGLRGARLGSVGPGVIKRGELGLGVLGFGPEKDLWALVPG